MNLNEAQYKSLMKGLIKGNIPRIKIDGSEVATAEDLTEKTEMYFIDGAPTLENEPFISWGPNFTEHAGDMAYDRLSGNTYQFSLDGEEAQWILMEDRLEVGVGTEVDPSTTTSNTPYINVTADGTLIANNAVIRGDIYARNGYFSGELRAATGSFSGDVTMKKRMVLFAGEVEMSFQQSDFYSMDGIKGNEVGLMLRGTYDNDQTEYEPYTVHVMAGNSFVSSGKYYHNVLLGSGDPAKPVRICNQIIDENGYGFFVRKARTPQISNWLEEAEGARFLIKENGLALDYLEYDQFGELNRTNPLLILEHTGSGISPVLKVGELEFGPYLQIEGASICAKSEDSSVDGTLYLDSDDGKVVVKCPTSVVGSLTTSGAIKSTGGAVIANNCTAWNGGTAGGYISTGGRLALVSGSTSDYPNIVFVKNKNTSANTTLRANNTSSTTYTLTLPNSTGTLATTSSDIRLKENIKPSKVSALELIEKIKLHEFDWLPEGKEGAPHWKIGMIADELEELDENLVFGGGKNEDGSLNVKGIETTGLLAYVVGSIRELYAMIKEVA